MSVSYDDPTYLEQVYAALFSLLTSATFAGGVTLESSARVVNPPDNVPVAAQPALILVEGGLLSEQQKTAFGAEMSKWTFAAYALIYARGDSTEPNPDPLPITVANYLIWGIKNCFATKPPNLKQTLGGLVVNAWIEGEVHPEVVNEQMVIMVPILMLAGPSGG